MDCWHMSGAGNDFMVIDARDQNLPLEKMAVEFCRITGADGFMAVDRSQRADFRLHFYNSDGSRGEMCGNGSRCICRFAYDRGLAGPTMTVETDAGLVSGWRMGEDRYRVRLNDPRVIDLNRLPEAAYVELGDPGVPHGLVEVPGLTWLLGEARRDQAEALRWNPAFPKGANISFYTWLGEGRVRIMTFERGVEDFTLACGTGCGALAAMLWTRGQLPGGHLTAENRGGVLEVRVEAQGDRIQALFLEGPTAILNKYNWKVPGEQPAK